MGVGLGLVAGGAVGRWRGATDQVGFEDEAWRPGEGEGVAGAVYKETGRASGAGTVDVFSSI